MTTPMEPETTRDGLARHIEINVGKACNNRCRFCMSSRPDEVDFRLATYESLVDDLARHRAQGCDSVGFLGGDVSIHPRMDDLLARARELGYADVQIITNAMVFCDRARAESAVAAGLTRVNVSVHSHDPAVEDYLTQVPGGLVRKLGAIRHFSELHRAGKLRRPVSINVVLNRHNCAGIVKTCWFFFSRMGISDIRVNFVWPEYSLGEYAKDVALRYSEFIPRLRELVPLALKNGIRVTFDTVPPCVFREAFPDDYAKLLPIFLGEQFDFIDRISVTGLGVEFSWKERKRDELKYQPKFCNDCGYRGTCDGTWREYVDLFGADGMSPVRRSADHASVDRLRLGAVKK